MIIDNGVITKQKHTTVFAVERIASSNVNTPVYCHQGFTRDESGNYYYIDTHNIYKYDPTNTTQLATTTLDVTGIGNHLGDGCVYKGFLYVPYEKWSGMENHGDYKMVKLNLSDLSVVETYDMNCGFETSGIYITNERVYVTSYHQTGVQVYDLNHTNFKLNHIGSLETDFFPPSCQSISGYGGKVSLLANTYLYIYEFINQNKCELVKVIGIDTPGAVGEGHHWEDENNVKFHKDVGSGVTTIADIFISGFKPELKDINTINTGFGIIVNDAGGSIYMKLKVSSLYNYNTLLDHFIHQDKNEFWIYSDGRIAGRIGDGTDSALLPNGTISTNVSHEIVIKWKSDSYGKVKYTLEVDGTITAEKTQNQVDIGLLAIGGMNLGNTLGKFELERFGFFRDTEDHSLEVFN